ncbi:MAG: VPLPA-CTERM sorting domain-containing protein [Parvularculaceae bacterium]|nr:VPLPA-CTERM sorting domain-containing protein [Parvularculaceae bacterium]
MRKIAAVSAAIFGLFTASANAAVITVAGAPDALGTQAQTLLSSFGNNLRFTFVSRSASFTSNLSLVFGNQFIFDNRVTPGTTVTATGPAAGAEILLNILVTNTGNSWNSGDPTQNSDGFVHAMISALGGGVFRVSFEDLQISTRPGAEPDFNDFVFDVQEVPVPGAALLLLTGIAGFGFAARRKSEA